MIYKCISFDKTDLVMSKIIMCIDMDAFFASVEQQSKPYLRGKPIAVIGSGSRTVITTSSYEARQFGVKTGMNIFEAKRLCPQLIFVKGDNGKYIHTCRELERIYRSFTPDVEMYSIDEAFLDVTGTHHLFGGVDELGRTIKGIIKRHLGITCTIGAGPSTLIAKLASDTAKPDGFMYVPLEEVASFLEKMPVKKLWGIGAMTSQKLEAMGIRTCSELGRTPVEVLRARFGIIGECLKSMGMGLWDRRLKIKEEEPRSIGHGMTLPRDIYERDQIEAYLLQLSEMVGRRARRYGYEGKKVSLTLRYSDFETFTKQTTLPFPTNETHVIWKAAARIFDTIRLREKIRLLGVRLSCLTREIGQMSLWGSHEKKKPVIKAMDEVNNRFGEFHLIWASYQRVLKAPSVISPAWRPDGVKHIEVR